MNDVNNNHKDDSASSDRDVNLDPLPIPRNATPPSPDPVVKSSPQDTCLPGPISDTALLTLQSNIVFLDGPQAGEPVIELVNKFPKLPEASPYFHACLETCKPMIDNPRHWPNPPQPENSDESEEDKRKIWSYVFDAFHFFVENYETLCLRAPTHGEGWADVNVWALLWDHAFLKSLTLTIDRKELSPKSSTISIKHDGILRAAKPSCSRNLGFMEVKPERSSCQNTKGFLVDRLKVIESIVATLKDHNTLGIIVGGIICNGMSFNIIRGADLGTGQYVFKESSLDVSLKTLPYVVLSCWRMKLALEVSYSVIISTLPLNNFE